MISDDVLNISEKAKQTRPYLIPKEKVYAVKVIVILPSHFLVNITKTTTSFHISTNVSFFVIDAQ